MTASTRLHNLRIIGDIGVSNSQQIMDHRKRIKIKPKRPVRLYKMTVSTFHYDKPTHQLIEFEAHFKIARRGRVKTVRGRLARLGGRHLQNWLRRERKIWIPKRKLRTAFERETYAKKQEAYAIVRRFSMRRVKKRWIAKELRAGRMRYAKKRRKKIVKA